MFLNLSNSFMHVHLFGHIDDKEEREKYIA